MTDDSEDHVWAIVAKQRIAMLTTESEGRLASRPMACIARPDENRIYFVTRIDAKGRRDRRLRAGQPRLFRSAQEHLSVDFRDGTASQDREKLRELWSMFVEAWLPQGPDAEDVALITVEPEEAKLWDSTSSNLIYAGKVLKAVATQTPPNGGRVEEVHMGGGASNDGKAPDADVASAYDKKMRDLGDAGGAPSLGGPGG